MRKLSLVLVLALLASCTKKQAGSAAIQDAPAQPSPTAPAATAFVNPGGKWMPNQLPLAENAANLKKLGAEFDVAQFSDPTGPYLGAVVSLEGCSGSFVSPEGLVVTNYHCAKGCLQKNSTPEANLMVKGFLAKDRSDERPCEVSKKIYVTQEVTNVSAEVLNGLESIEDPNARFTEIENRQKALIKKCEETQLRCELKSFFEGAEFYLIKKKEIKDIRLVYSPDKTVGKFGGEIDNWEWPRQTGDFAFFRAYVDEKGESKPYAKEANHVPYKNAHHLKLASSPLKPGDLVLIAGYPGRTSRLKIGAELEEHIDWTLPRNIRLLPQWINALKEVAKSDKEAAIRVAQTIASLENVSKNNVGVYNSLKGHGFAEKRYALEKELQTWIEADAGRKAKWGSLIPEIAKHFGEYRVKRDAENAFANVAVRRPQLLLIANLLVKNAEERQKPDDQREPEFQARNEANLENSLKAGSAAYVRAADTVLYGINLDWAIREIKGEDQPKEVFAALFGTADPKPEDIAPALAKLYDGTTLDKLENQLDLFKNATPESLAASTDTMIQYAVKLRPLIKAYDERQKAFEGKAYAGGMASLRPKYIEALRAFSESKHELVAPDANSTLRVSYGTVKGYRKTPEAAVYYPFTWVEQILEKNATKGDLDEFTLTDRFKKVAQAKNFGPYATLEGGKMPVCFLADVDSTGGNSGSATFNAKGELIGLLFDGTMEGLGRDWVWNPDLGTSIHVDVRYMLWVMDAVDGADTLLQEMGVTPSIHTPGMNN